MPRKKRNAGEVNAGSMADIAFLLLIFFLVTTTIASDKGLAIQLPPKPDPNDPPPEVKFNERNLFKVLVNSQDRMLVEGEPMDDASQLREMVQTFVNNNGRDPQSSDNPQDAVVSFKTDRGTSYNRYIEVLDELQGAYYDLYAQRLGLTVKQIREINDQEPSVQDRYDELKKEIPMNISIAEPSKVGGGN
uniref:Biopolymer transporter ExbD n=1 Tax=Roseihalotalea indica TaxID=2867963 RepID=A0AA49GPA0_9BACT|nr:biopolymer transporter ExbD [Tunicatimonas sp. TK19036]